MPYLPFCLQELQIRLSDEIGKLRSFITSRCSGDRSQQNNERSSCELEVQGAWDVSSSLGTEWRGPGATQGCRAVQEGGAQASPACLSWGTMHHFPLPSSSTTALAPGRTAATQAVALCFPLP